MRELRVALVNTGVLVADTVEVEVEMDEDVVVVDVMLTVVVELLLSYCNRKHMVNSFS